MPIVMRLDRMMIERKITSTELAARIGTTTVNLSNIKNGKIKGVRFATLEAICQVLNCKPGDIIDYVTPEQLAAEHELGEIRERNYPERKRSQKQGTPAKKAAQAKPAASQVEPNATSNERESSVAESKGSLDDVDQDADIAPYLNPHEEELLVKALMERES